MNKGSFHINRFTSHRFNKYIECIKFYDFKDDKPIQLSPEGCFEMILQLDYSFYNETSATKGWEVRPHNFLGGLHNKSYRIRSENKGSKLISIQFTQNGAMHFIPDKLTLFKNKIICLDDIYSPSVLKSLLDLDLEQNSQTTLSKLDCFLEAIFKERAPSPIEPGLQMILKQNGTVSIDGIAARVGLSASHFRKRFNEEIGMSPKEYCKIVRINKALECLAIDPKISLTKLSYALGCFDQSHFIREFKSVMDSTPRKHLLME